MSGTIREINGKPIAAPVRLKVGDLIFYTKVDGHYYIWLLPGVYTVDIYKENYRPSAFSIKVLFCLSFFFNSDLLKILIDFKENFSVSVEMFEIV